MKIHSAFPQDGEGLWIFLRLIEKITPVFTRISTNREKQNKNPQAISRNGEDLWIF